MKNYPFHILSLLVLIALTLSACSSPNMIPTNSASAAGPSPATKLAVGTLKLQNTPQALTTAQASKLLDLWQAYQALTASDTSAQAELDGLVKQIQGVLTAEQLQAIDAMGLNAQVVAETAQNLSAEVGLNESTTPQPAAESSQPAAESSQPAAGNAGPGGMPPGGGMEIGSDPAGGMPASSTAEAGASTQATDNNAIVLTALITALQDQVATQ